MILSVSWVNDPVNCNGRIHCVDSEAPAAPAAPAVVSINLAWLYLSQKKSQFSAHYPPSPSQPIISKLFPPSHLTASHYTITPVWPCQIIKLLNYHDHDVGFALLQTNVILSFGLEHSHVGLWLDSGLEAGCLGDQWLQSLA